MARARFVPLSTYEELPVDDMRREASDPRSGWTRSSTWERTSTSRSWS